MTTTDEVLEDFDHLFGEETDEPENDSWATVVVVHGSLVTVQQVNMGRQELVPWAKTKWPGCEVHLQRAFAHRYAVVFCRPRLAKTG